jgi:subtilisin family serine protease
MAVLVLLMAAASLAAAFATHTAIPSAHGAASRRDAAASAPPRQTQIVVRARSARDIDRVVAYAGAHGYTVTQRVDEPPAITVLPPDGVGVVRAVTGFTGKPGVLYAEPAYPLRLSDVPADPLYARQSAYLEVEHAPEAWDIEKGRARVIVAVLDTGVDTTHPDLQGRIWTNPADQSANAVDDDNNGCVDDARGCAFVSDPEPGCDRATDGAVRDDLGHGTFVSGIIAASGNGQGMVGVARGVTIMPVKVLDCSGGGSSFALAQGIIYAARNGAGVINVSLGGPIDSAFLREAVRIAHDEYGVLIVAATGNTTGGPVAYPARYPGVLAVGATSGQDPDRPAVFTSAGPEVGVVAVGEGIVGPVPKGTCKIFLPCLTGFDNYAAGDGTSFAAPQATGLVALMLSRNGFLKPDQIISTIKASADAVPAGARPNWSGAGRINMLRALKPPYRIGAPGTTRGN